jgi:D-inositol-3-phosphate glycosyltransferase
MMRAYAVDPGKIEIIPGGVDVAVFRPQDRQQMRRRLVLEPGQPVLLFVGRLQPLKGIDILLRAAQIVRQQYASLQVIVVGGGVDTQDDHEVQERQRLQTLCRELGLTDRVRFVKAQSQDVLVQYYTAADVFVMPSHYESFGMVVLEAMACGTPVVASNVGGLASTVVHGSTGFLVPEGDSYAFAEAILRLVGSPALREAYGQASVQRAQDFTWARIVARTVQLYRRLLRQGGAVSRRHASVMPCPF